MAFPVYWPLKAALQHLSDWPIHTHIYTLMAEAAIKGGNCSSEFGVQYLDQGHFDVQLGRAEIRTRDIPDPLYLLSYSL